MVHDQQDVETKKVTLQEFQEELLVGVIGEGCGLWLLWLPHRLRHKLLKVRKNLF